ncbi:hypothetical protein GCM10008957_55290 [Deinococcus ruber]|uniref:Uncharacterized protein n=1 Tax=Deinococcus ruber TaxID=1848197 RepID=A0A918FI83_9DEIO|nr:hypothetical protein GCM10008957_55290 [Deinococcus ruber]
MTRHPASERTLRVSPLMWWLVVSLLSLGYVARGRRLRIFLIEAPCDEDPAAAQRGNEVLQALLTALAEPA